ncbi:hypothetical protein SLA2020_111230 [Shorea laevis]
MLRTYLKNTKTKPGIPSRDSEKSKGPPYAVGSVSFVSKQMRYGNPISTEQQRKSSIQLKVKRRKFC